MAESSTDRGATDGNGPRFDGQIHTFTDYAARYAETDDPRDWDGARIFQIYFENGSKIIACSKSAPNLKNALACNDDGVIEPRLWEIRAPYYQAFRADCIVAIVEILPRELLEKPPDEKA
jgi:hypothetical protein